MAAELGPRFTRLLWSTAASQLGDRVHAVALAAWAYAFSGSTTQMGLVLVAATLPAVLLGPVAGALVDRLDRRLLMVATDLVRGVLALLFAVCTLLGVLNLPVAIALTALLAIGTAMFQPAALAAPPRLVAPEQLVKATGSLEGVLQLMGVLGPALGGGLLALVGLHGPGLALAFGLNAFSFLASAMLLWGLGALPPDDAAAAEPFSEAIGGGLRLLGRERAIAGALAVFAGVNLFTMPVLLFMPAFATRFGVGTWGLGAMEAALGLGMAGAALLWARLGAPAKRWPVAVGGLALVGLAIGGMGLWPAFGPHALALALAGVGMGSMNVMMISHFQQVVPGAELGRFFALLTSACMALIPLSHLLFGLAGDAVDPAKLLLGCGGMVLLASGALAAVPGFREA